MAQGEFVQVRQHLEAALRITTDLGESDDYLYSMLVDAAARQEDLAALELYQPLAEASAGKYEHLLYQAIANRSEGVAHRLRGEPVEAEGRLDQALLQFQELGTHWQQGRTLSELGKLAAVQGDNNISRQHYRKALELFEEMGAQPDIERTQAAIGGISWESD